MTSEGAEVLTILKLLAKKIEISDSHMNSQAISNALVRHRIEIEIVYSFYALQFFFS